MSIVDSGGDPDSFPRKPAKEIYNTSDEDLSDTRAVPASARRGGCAGCTLSGAEDGRDISPASIVILLLLMLLAIRRRVTGLPVR